MSKIAGLKGRSPETYPGPKRSGLVKTLASVNPSSVLLGTSLTTLLSAIVDVPAGNVAAIVMYSGVLDATGSAFVTVEVILNVTTVWTQQIEVTTTNQPLPFSVVFDTEYVSSAPLTINIQAYASLASTVTVAAGGSIVVMALPTT